MCVRDSRLLLDILVPKIFFTPTTKVTDSHHVLIGVNPESFLTVS